MTPIYTLPEDERMLLAFAQVQPSGEFVITVDSVLVMLYERGLDELAEEFRRRAMEAREKLKWNKSTWSATTSL